MKKILYAATALSLATCSCHTVNLAEMRSSSQPYVQLKNGEKYTGEFAKRKAGPFVKDRIVLSDTSFRSKDVAFYSTGGAIYANVGRRAFAPQVAEGKINLFKYSYRSSKISYNYSGIGPSTTYSTQRRIEYYIQKKEGDPVRLLTYNHLAPMVSARTPEYRMLEKYRKTRTVSRVLGYGSLGLIGGGFVMASGNGPSSNIGAALVGVGVATAVGWAVTLLHNRGRLLKTVMIADKVRKHSSRYRRVRGY